MRQLTHLDKEGKIEMVDISHKPQTVRQATARCRVRLEPQTIEALKTQALPKGEAIAAAKVAGILAAKKTDELIPLTHSLGLSHVGVEVDLLGSHVMIHATAQTTASTGPEMEALTAAAISALTLYDMCKSVQQGIVIEELVLVSKSGGKSGE